MKQSGLLVSENRTFVIMNVLIMPAMVNILIACTLANLLFPPGAAIFLWGPSSMIIDLLISSFMASLITGIIGFYTTLASCNNGQLRLPDAKYPSGRTTGFSYKPWRSNLFFALLALILTSIVLAVFVLSYEQETISWVSFLWVKSIQALLVSVYSSLAGTLLAIRYFQNRQEATESCA